MHLYIWVCVWNKLAPHYAELRRNFYDELNVGIKTAIQRKLGGPQTNQFGLRQRTVISVFVCAEKLTFTLTAFPHSVSRTGVFHHTSDINQIRHTIKLGD